MVRIDFIFYALLNDINKTLIGKLSNAERGLSYALWKLGASSSVRS